MDACPLDGEWLTKGVVYEVKVIVDGAGNDMIYIGSASTTFKNRYGNHNASLRREKKQKSTKLSKHVWELKQSGVEYQRILCRAKEYSTLSKRCNLCLTEELFIMTARKETHLNSRTDQCQRQKEQSLTNLTTPMFERASLLLFSMLTREFVVFQLCCTWRRFEKDDLLEKDIHKL